MSAVQIARCKVRFTDPAAAERFAQMLQRADALVHEAAEMRREAWAAYRAAILEAARSAEPEIGQYA